jgi:bifunctional non-homologous end joining protein LigD
VQWVTPKLVVEIGFSEWTPAGLLRHPRYLGIREDKTAAEVRKEG